MSRAEQVSVYTFIPGSHITDSDVKTITKDLRKTPHDLPQLALRPDLSFEQRLERIHAVTTLIENHQLWVEQRLELSTSKRQPFITQVIFYTPDTWKKFPEAMQPMRAFRDRETNVIAVKEDTDPSQQYADANHEIAHALMAKKIAVYTDDHKEKSPKYISLGYLHAADQAFFVLNEAVAEMANIESLQQLKEAGTDYVTETKRGYGKALIFIDMLFDHAAQRVGLSREAFQTEIYKGAYKDPTIGLLLLKRALGTHTMRILAKMNDTYHRDIPTFTQTAKDMGIDAAAYEQKVKAYKNGKPVSVLGGIPIQAAKPHLSIWETIWQR